MKTLLIKNGTIINSKKIFNGDIFISNGVIKSIKNQINDQADHIIDATDRYIFPGGIDVHTHMELPHGNISSSDTFSSGTKAALFGGTTTIIDFANQTKGNSLQDAIDLWNKKANNNCYCDYSFHMAIVDINKKTLEEIKTMIEKYGITSFKTFLAYEKLMLNLKNLEILMKKIKELDCFISCHAEDGNIINKNIKNFKDKNKCSVKFHYLSHPDSVEEKAIENLIHLSKETSCPVYIVHLSSMKGLELIKKAQLKGIDIKAETCTQYLLLDKKEYYHHDFKHSSQFVMSPPVRTQNDRNALWDGIANNVIKVIATDHCPFTLKQKEIGKEDFSIIPNGVPGVENRFELIFSEGVNKKKISLNKFVQVISTNPAKIFGLSHKKGDITEGLDADLVIFNPFKTHKISFKTHHANCDYSVYEGFEVTGKCEKVILRGTLSVENNNFLLTKKIGNYIPRKKVKKNYPKKR